MSCVISTLFHVEISTYKIIISIFVINIAILHRQIHHQVKRAEQSVKGHNKLNLALCLQVHQHRVIQEAIYILLAE